MSQNQIKWLATILILIAHVVLIRSGTDAHHWSVKFSDVSMDFCAKLEKTRTKHPR